MTPSPTIKSIDTRGLSQVMAEMAAIFYKRGASETMVQQFVRTEAGQMAKAASDAIGPKNVTQAKSKAENNVKTFLNSDFSEVSGVRKYSTFENDRQAKSSYQDWQWLTAGPNFLLGVRPADNQPSIDGLSAVAAFRGQQRAGHGRGKAYVRIGTRITAKGKHQAIIQLNRTRVSKAAFESVKTGIISKIGEAKASFAAAALRLSAKLRFQTFVTAKIPAVEANGKSIFSDSGITNATAPSVEFGSHAPGVESNPIMAEAIQNAANSRQRAASNKLDKLLKDAVYDLNNGRTYTPKGDQSESEI